MLIQPIPSGPFETNAYVLACPETRKAAIVDPAPESAHKIITYLTENQLTPDKILLTHSHWDHIADTSILKKKYHIPVYIHSLDTPNLLEPGADGLPCWIEIEGVQPDRLVKEGDEIAVGNLKARVIETPGHTPGGVCFYFEEPGVLISGDTLFKGTIGNLSFGTSRPHLMWDSLKKLAALPPQTQVYPGHGPSTTIGAEKWLNRAEEYFGDL